MGTRVLKEVLYLKHEFTNDERLTMGSDLGAAYNRMAEIEAEAKVMKDQIKERTSQVEATIGTLSRHLNNGYMMENVDCELIYDAPNVGEVSYKRRDNGAIAKTRAMTGAENQQEIEFAAAETEAATAPTEASVTNIADFFGTAVAEAIAEQEEEDAEEEEDDEDEEEVDPLAVFSDQTPGANLEAIKPENDALFENVPADEKRGRGRPKGSTSKATEEVETF